MVIKYVGDTRYNKPADVERGPTVRTHSHQTFSSEKGSASLASVKVVEAGRLTEVDIERFEPKIGLVAIDEGQFYPDLAERVDAWMRTGFQVVIAALSGDYRRHAFPQVSAVIPYATKCTMLSAVCMLCTEKRNDAAYTVRTVDSAEVKLVGASGMYRSACLSCYLAFTSGRRNR